MKGAQESPVLIEEGKKRQIRQCPFIWGEGVSPVTQGVHTKKKDAAKVWGI